MKESFGSSTQLAASNRASDPLGRCKSLVEKLRSEIAHEDDENYWISKLGLTRTLVADEERDGKEEVLANEDKDARQDDATDSISTPNPRKEAEACVDSTNWLSKIEQARLGKREEAYQNADEESKKVRESKDEARGEPSTNWFSTKAVMGKERNEDEDEQHEETDRAWLSKLRLAEEAEWRDKPAESQRNETRLGAALPQDKKSSKIGERGVAARESQRAGQKAATPTTLTETLQGSKVKLVAKDNRSAASERSGSSHLLSVSSTKSNTSHPLSVSSNKLNCHNGGQAMAFASTLPAEDVVPSTAPANDAQPGPDGGTIAPSHNTDGDIEDFAHEPVTTKKAKIMKSLMKGLKRRLRIQKVADKRSVLPAQVEIEARGEHSRLMGSSSSSTPTEEVVKSNDADVKVKPSEAEQKDKEEKLLSDGAVKQRAEAEQDSKSSTAAQNGVKHGAMAAERSESETKVPSIGNVTVKGTAGTDGAIVPDENQDAPLPSPDKPEQSSKSSSEVDLGELEENSKMILQQFRSIKNVFAMSRAQSSELFQNVFRNKSSEKEGKTTVQEKSNSEDAAEPPEPSEGIIGILHTAEADKAAAMPKETVQSVDPPQVADGGLEQPVLSTNEAVEELVAPLKEPLPQEKEQVPTETNTHQENKMARKKQATGDTKTERPLEDPPKEQRKAETKRGQGSLSVAKGDHKKVVGKTFREIAKSFKGSDKSKKKELAVVTECKHGTARRGSKSFKNVHKRMDEAEISPLSPSDQLTVEKEDLVTDIKTSNVAQSARRKSLSSYRVQALPAFKGKEQKKESNGAPVPQAEAEQGVEESAGAHQEPQVEDDKRKAKKGKKEEKKKERAVKKERKEKRKKEKKNRKREGKADSDLLETVGKTPDKADPIISAREEDGNPTESVESKIIESKHWAEAAPDRSREKKHTSTQSTLKKMVSWSEEVKDKQKEKDEEDAQAVIWWSSSREAVEVLFDDEEEKSSESEELSTSSSYASYPTAYSDDQTFLSELEPQIDFSFSTLKEVTETIVEEAAIIRQEVTDAGKDMLRETASDLAEKGEGMLKRWLMGGAKKKEKKDKQKQRQRKQKKQKKKGR